MTINHSGLGGPPGVASSLPAIVATRVAATGSAFGQSSPAESRAAATWQGPPRRARAEGGASPFPSPVSRVRCPACGPSPGAGHRLVPVVSLSAWCRSSLYGSPRAVACRLDPAGSVRGSLAADRPAGRFPVACCRWSRRVRSPGPRVGRHAALSHPQPGTLIGWRSIRPVGRGSGQGPVPPAMPGPYGPRAWHLGWDRWPAVRSDTPLRAWAWPVRSRIRWGCVPARQGLPVRCRGQRGFDPPAPPAGPRRPPCPRGWGLCCGPVPR
jgi:hypothetical protein